MMAHCASKPLQIVHHAPTEGFEKAVPFGDLPALEIDLQMYSQVVPLQRFFGRVCGFVPEDPVEVRDNFPIYVRVEIPYFETVPIIRIPVPVHQLYPNEI